MSAFRVELQFDRGTAHVTVEANDALEANRKALRQHKSAFGARSWRTPPTDEIDAQRAIEAREDARRDCGVAP